MVDTVALRRCLPAPAGTWRLAGAVAHEDRCPHAALGVGVLAARELPPPRTLIAMVSTQQPAGQPYRRQGGAAARQRRRNYFSAISRRRSHASPSSLQCFGFQHPLGQRKHDPFFLVKMRARCRNGAQQNFLRRLHVARLADFGQFGFDHFVLVVKRFLLADLIEAMFQRFHEQIVLGFGVRFVDLFDRCGQRLDFGECFQARHHRFDVVEQVMEHRMFCAQDVSNFHGKKIPVSNSALPLFVPAVFSPGWESGVPVSAGKTRGLSGLSKSPVLPAKAGTPNRRSLPVAKNLPIAKLH